VDGHPLEPDPLDAGANVPGGSYNNGAGVSREAKRIRIRLNWPTQLTPALGWLTAGETAQGNVDDLQNPELDVLLQGPRWPPIDNSEQFGAG
jgi:hypothetical protein